MISSKSSRFAWLFFILIFSGLLVQCSDPEAPDLPASIQIVSGDNQFSRFSTAVPDPLVVRLTTESGAPASGYTIVFEPTAGDGSFTIPKAVTNDDGVASSHFTLGPLQGANSAVAYLEGTRSLSVPFNAMASYAYCPEAETTLAVFHGIQGRLYLATSKSSMFPDHSGVIRVDPLFYSQTVPFVGFPTNIFTTQIWDIAFSPKGDLYLSTSTIFDDVLIATADGDV
ncbi:MAG: hypothetical protein ABIA59_02180, partial [Candidatus Latescibacterota bacterium]